MIDLNEKRYLGMPCKHGHRYGGLERSVRYRKSRNCVLCSYRDSKKWIAKDPARHAKKQQGWRDRMTPEQKAHEKKYQSNYWFNVRKESKCL